MSDRDLTAGELDELREHAVDALLALARVGLGDHDVRIETSSFGALNALFAGINDLLTGLGVEHEQGGSFRRALEEKLAFVERQRAAIRDLSTPIIEVWEGVLCIPVVGVVDTVRSAEIADTLLRAIARQATRSAIIDITGIEVMDTGTVDHLLRLAKAVRLLGADCVLTGLAPQIAQTIVQMGIDLSSIVTHRSLRDALQPYVIADSQPT